MWKKKGFYQKKRKKKNIFGNIIGKMVKKMYLCTLKMRNEEWGMRNGEWGMGNEEWGMNLIMHAICWNKILE